jgi:hypothetical protein
MTKNEFKEYIDNQTFNVYDQEYSEKFINDLPVNFYKIKNKDLSKVPDIYRVLFITDWNWGNYSKMDMLDRNYCNELYLEYNNFCVLKEILKKYDVNTDNMDIHQLKKEYKKYKDVK